MPGNVGACLPPLPPQLDLAAVGPSFYLSAHPTTRGLRRTLTVRIPLILAIAFSFGIYEIAIASSVYESQILLDRFSHKLRRFATKPVVLVGADHRVGPLPISTHCSVRICGKARTSTLLGGHSGPPLLAPREKSGLAVGAPRSCRHDSCVWAVSHRRSLGLGADPPFPLGATGGRSSGAKTDSVLARLSMSAPSSMVTSFSTQLHSGIFRK